MASGPGSQDPMDLSTDKTFDINCSVCERKQMINEAVTYCTACRDYFCQECLDVHNSLAALRGHLMNVLGKSTLFNSTDGSRDIITTKCEEHTDKIVEIYCRKHDVVCCSVCLAVKHNGCKGAEYVSSVAVGISGTNVPTQLKSDLQNMKQDITSIKSSRQKEQTRIYEENDRMLTHIKDARRRINETFDELEESISNGGQTQHRINVGKLQKDMDGCDAAIRNIEAAIKRLDIASKQNDSQLFVDTQIATEKLDEFRELAKQMQEQRGEKTLNFSMYEGVESYLASLKRMGKFVRELVSAGKAETVIRRETAIVKMKQDKETCSIHGSCCLPDGGVLLSDYNNDKLKRLDSSYQVIDSCHIRAPWGVCYNHHTHEAAVCQSDGEIHIVSVRKTMATIRIIDTNHSCYGISYNNGQLYVGHKGYKVHAYDFSTGLKQYPLQDGQPVFSSSIRHIATIPDGTRIWVADGVHGLMQLDESGNLLRTVKDDELAGTSGVCLGSDNSVLVCGSDSRTVLQLSSGGEKVCTLVQTDDLPARPLSICYDMDRDRLLVTMYSCDHVMVFHIK